MACASVCANKDRLRRVPVRLGVAIFVTASALAGCTSFVSVNEVPEHPDRGRFTAMFDRQITPITATTEQGMLRLEALHALYTERRNRDSRVRNGSSIVALISSVTAAASGVTGDPDSLSLAAGLVGGTAFSATQLVAPAARIPIFIAGELALNCAREEAQKFVGIEDLPGALATKLGELRRKLEFFKSEYDGLSGISDAGLRPKIATIELAATQAETALSDATLAQTDIGVAGDRVWTTVGEIENTVNRWLHQIDVDLIGLTE